MLSDQDIILGIDLGTTYSAMAYVDRFGKPNIIPNSDGHATTPSAIYFYSKQACVVGEEAIKMVVVDPTNVVRFIKRYMGDQDYELDFFEDLYTPQELSAFILRRLKEDAEEALGVPVKHAVLTVPAYFNAAQRGATAEAGRIAGLNVLSILNEPTAAAIALAMDKLGERHRMLVFDLGGGTFDVTVMEIKGTHLRTIATDGNAELGGKDWDDRLVNYVAEKFMEKHGIDPRDEPRPYQELYERCLQAKIALSSKPRAVIPVTFRGKRSIVKLTRQDFEQMTHDLVEQCSDTCQLVMEKANFSWEDLDEILLVGGSTRMPMIRMMLRDRFGFNNFRDVNPDECVALGASLTAVFRHQEEHTALKAYRDSVLRRAPESDPAEPEDAGEDIFSASPQRFMQGEFGAFAWGLPGVEITDVASHPLGVVVLDAQHQEHVINLIPEATPLPCEKRSRFAYAYDNMTAVRVEVTEGDGVRREDVTVIGELVLDRLPPRPRGTPIDVIYRYTVDQILEVDILDVQTGQHRQAKINLKGGLSEHRLDEARDAISQANIRRY